MRLLCFLLIYPAFASAEIKQGVTYSFSVEKKSFNGSASQFQQSAVIVDEKDGKVLVQRNYSTGEVYSYWYDRPLVDGGSKWGSEEIKMNCKGSTSLIKVPAGTFLTCPIFQNYYEDHGHYGTDTRVTTWYGPVLDGIVKMEISRTTLGDHRTSTYKMELKAITE